MSKWIRLAAGLALASSVLAHAQSPEKKTVTLSIGYESYGRLNATGDNAIFIAHFAKRPAYWDSVVGPGKPFDTDRYFILSVDAEKADFGLHDFVHAQKALADALGIKRFAAVAFLGNDVRAAFDRDFDFD